jgi:hypothetical protein
MVEYKQIQEAVRAVLEGERQASVLREDGSKVVLRMKRRRGKVDRIEVIVYPREDQPTGGGGN